MAPVQWASVAARQAFAASAQVFCSSTGGIIPLSTLASRLSNARVVYLGEIHHVPDVLRFQMSVLEAVAAAAKPRDRLQVVLEQFAIDQQVLLDEFMDRRITVEELDRQYQDTGTEGFNIKGHYSELLKFGRDELGCTFRAGFLPRRLARSFMTTGEALRKAVDDAVASGFISPEATRLMLSEDSRKVVLGAEEPEAPDGVVRGTLSHEYVFESLIAGRDIEHPDTEHPPSVTGQYRRIFPAQIIKDVSMASAVVRALRESQDSKVIAIAGVGHFQYEFGVPERVNALLGPGAASVPSVSLTVTHRETDEALTMRPAVFPDAQRRYAADYTYYFEFDEEEE